MKKSASSRIPINRIVDCIIIVIVYYSKMKSWEVIA